MNISAELEKQYPKLSAWITANLPAVRKKPKVFKAFQKYAELKEVVAERALTAGTDPCISFRHMPDANGEFEGDTHPNTVFLAKEICDKFEGSKKHAGDARMHVLIESTLLHEMVHWGDWKDGKDQPGEEGKNFEKEAYGKDIDRYW